MYSASRGGLINTTWRIRTQSEEYILQRINHDVFKNPLDITDNIDTLTCYLRKNYPEYYFVSPVRTKDNQGMVQLPDEGYFRLFPYVQDSFTYEVTQRPEQAFEAALQFGLFTKTLRAFPVNLLKITLPSFHDLTARYDQFSLACLQGNPARVQEAEKAIQLLQKHEHIVSTYKQITTSNQFRLRVTHHDTKTSNVLFDVHHKGICVIDLDTVMPGYFISDIGDMMRTYLSPASEKILRKSRFGKTFLRE